MCLQLPTGKTAWVDTAWWLGLSDRQQEAFYERDYGSESDPLRQPFPTGPEDPGEEPE